MNEQLVELVAQKEHELIVADSYNAKEFAIRTSDDFDQDRVENYLADMDENLEEYNLSTEEGNDAARNAVILDIEIEVEEVDGYNAVKNFVEKWSERLLQKRAEELDISVAPSP